MRAVGGKEYFEALMKASEELGAHRRYGPTTISARPVARDRAVNKFSYGVAAAALICVPHSFVNNGQGLSGRSPPELDGRPLPIVRSQDGSEVLTAKKAAA